LIVWLKNKKNKQKNKQLYAQVLKLYRSGAVKEAIQLMVSINISTPEILVIPPSSPRCLTMEVREVSDPTEPTFVFS